MSFSWQAQCWLPHLHAQVRVQPLNAGRGVMVRGFGLGLSPVVAVVNGAPVFESMRGDVDGGAHTGVLGGVVGVGCAGDGRRGGG